MRPLTSSELLQVWEKSFGKSLVEKSIHLLAVACSVTDLKLLTHLSIGERDARLFQLRKWMFGNRMINLANCPQCTTAMEWEMKTEDFLWTEIKTLHSPCLLYTSDAADDLLCVDLGGRRIIQ